MISTDRLWAFLRVSPYAFYEEHPLERGEQSVEQEVRQTGSAAVQNLRCADD